MKGLEPLAEAGIVKAAMMNAKKDDLKNNLCMIDIVNICYVVIV